MESVERKMPVQSVKVHKFRDSLGSCTKLASSLRTEGVRRPITVWQDGTVISGTRRLHAALLAGEDYIPVVFVDTIEDAAKRLQADNEDDYLALPWRWSEVCRLWRTLRLLDEPAAKRRVDQARRRGVELRRQTSAGKRKPGRSNTRGDDYVANILGPAFNISGTGVRRIEAIYEASIGLSKVSDKRRQLAVQIMADLDDSGNVWACYQRWLASRENLPAPRLKPVAPADPAPTARQVAAWDKALPQMEGLVAGLVELGSPNPELTWEQVGPVHARLMVVRREIEKIINRMKETYKS